jgi:hypothetical protein
VNQCLKRLRAEKAGAALLTELKALREVADKARNLNEECRERYLNEALAALDALKESR